MGTFAPYTNYAAANVFYYRSEFCTYVVNEFDFLIVLFR